MHLSGNLLIRDLVNNLCMHIETCTFYKKARLHLHVYKVFGAVQLGGKEEKS